MSRSRNIRPVIDGIGDPRSLTRVLLDKMTEGVSLCSENGTIVYTNPAEDRLFGYAGGELLGQHVSVQNAYSPEENARVVADVIEELKRSGSWAGEWRNRRKDGQEFTTRSRISAVDLEGQRYWLCVQEDVTEESATALALGEERSRLALATKAGGIGIWDWDLVSGRMTYSERARAISGLPAEGEITLEMVSRTVHPDDYPWTSAQARRAIDPAIRDRTPYEYRIVLADGSIRWVQALGEAVFEEKDGSIRAVRYLGTIQDISTRHELEQAEREAAQRLRLAVDAGRMVIWDLDIVNDSVAHSPELNRLLGFPEHEPLDLDAVRACYAPGEQERLQAESQAVLAQGGTSFESSYWFVRPDGARRWLRLRCEVIFDEGRPVRALGVLSDETAQKRVEEELRSSEARLQLASAAAGAGVWDWDLVSDETVWSSEEYLLFEMDPSSTPQAEVVPTWMRLIHPDDFTPLMEQTERVRREGGTHDLDYRVILPSKGLRWIRSHQTAVAGPDGKITRLVGIETDVTEEYGKAEALRSRAQALQSEVEERGRALDRFFSLSGDLFAVAGFDGYLKSTNPAWSQLLGYSEQELLAEPFLRLIHSDDHAAAAEVVGRLQQGNAIQQFHHRLLTKDGRVIWIAWAAVSEGELFYAVGRDVTHEREREAILRQSQKMEALGQLTGGIAHDFNNLLQAAQGSFALIRKRPEHPDRVRYLAEQGLEVTRRGASLTAQLLAFSRVQRIEVRTVRVGPALEGMKDLLQRSLGPQLRIAIRVTDDRLAALVDPIQLEMAVLNLAINSRDAMPEGGTITLGVEPLRIERDPELPQGHYVAIHVTDTGAGMTPEVAERAFEPFFTTKGLGKGTGLGLSQVYAMARQAGGAVRIETAPGQGTTVRILLHQATEAADDGLPLIDGIRRPMLPASDATILVIDDDDAVRRSLVESVESLGFRAIEANDGTSGLAALEQAPDLMMVDFAMPGMNGAEVAHAARIRRPELPIILVTGYADTDALTAAVEAGSVVLRKPVELDELEATLHDRLRTRTGAGR